MYLNYYSKLLFHNTEFSVINLLIVSHSLSGLHAEHHIYNKRPRQIFRLLKELSDVHRSEVNARIVCRSR